MMADAVQKYTIIVIYTGILLTEAFPAAVVGTSSIIDKTIASACPGDLLSFNCVANDTSLLRWIYMFNLGDREEDIHVLFISLESVSTQHQKEVRGVTIRAVLTNKICNSSTFCSLMESRIKIPIRQDQVNLTVSCQSGAPGEEMDSIFIPINECNKTDNPMKALTINPATTTEVPGTMNPIVTTERPPNSGALISASLGVITLMLVTVICINCILVTKSLS